MMRKMKEEEKEEEEHVGSVISNTKPIFGCQIVTDNEKKV
jgi:hypothetical protein